MPLFTWISIGKLHVEWSLTIDTLSLTMMGVVTLVSFLVHLYSLGYMAQDRGKVRFMAYLSLFTFMMLLLVTAGNLIQLFVGWEGVGLCSYLLIGFWFEKEAATHAALKAFLVNRVGDLFFVLALVGLFWIYGTFSIASFVQLEPSFFSTSIGFCLLLAAMAKSAQLGFHLWLPSAMEGPTPVSALIHAATMVTAGIFLLLRFGPFLQSTPLVLEAAGIVGALTAVFGALMALFQKDLKRIIAYSTCSQLGYMMLAVGIGAGSAALFHLTTHAFFKALLFLGAGAVIHIYREQDVTRMGGLGFNAPVTYSAMLVGFLSLTGMPFFAAFFSKDLILEHAFHQNISLFVLGVIAAFITGLYATRTMLRVFHKNQNKTRTFKETPALFLIPLLILTLLSLGVGYVGYTGWGRLLLSLQEPTSPAMPSHITVWASFFGVLIGYALYGVLPHTSALLKEKLPSVYTFFFREAYGDTVYAMLFTKPFQILARLFAAFDIKYLDHYGPMGLARGVGILRHGFGKLQTGYLYHTVCIMVAGLVGVLLYLLVR
jgi:NADH-quinone oxidoreductase subunit L